MGSEITAGIEHKGRVLAFGEDSMHVISYLANNFVFGDQKLFNGIGSSGPDSVVSVDNRVFGFSHRGIWASDLSSYEYIDTPLIKSYIFERLGTNAAKHRRVVAWDDKANGRVVFFMPWSADQPDSAVAFKYRQRNNSWSILSYGRTAVDLNEVWPSAILGDAAGDVYAQNQLENPFTGGDSPVVPITDRGGITAGWSELGWGDLGWGGSMGLSQS